MRGFYHQSNSKKLKLDLWVQLVNFFDSCLTRFAPAQILFGLLIVVSAAQTNAQVCSDAFANKQHDVVLGRSGRSLNIHVLNLERRWQGRTSEFRRSRTATVIVPELFDWARRNGYRHFHDWQYFRHLPFQSVLALRNWKHNEPIVNALTDRSQFLDLMTPYLERIVSKGGKIHINLEPSDQQWLLALKELPATQRATLISEFQQWLRSEPENLEGATTRYELLAVCTNPRLFSAARFYRDYQSQIAQSESQLLWLGD